MKNVEQGLKYLKTRCCIFYDYFYYKYGKQDVYQKAKLVVETEYNKNNLKVLQITNKDLNTWLLMMPITDSIELGRILHDKLGEDISEIINRRLIAINKTISLGKISTKAEFEMISNRIEEIYLDKNKGVELEQLNNLINNYLLKVD